MKVTIDINDKVALISEWSDDGYGAENSKSIEAAIPSGLLAGIESWVLSVQLYDKDISKAAIENE